MQRASKFAGNTAGAGRKSGAAKAREVKAARPLTGPGFGEFAYHFGFLSSLLTANVAGLGPWGQPVSQSNPARIGKGPGRAAGRALVAAQVPGRDRTTGPYKAPCEAMRRHHAWPRDVKECPWLGGSGVDRRTVRSGNGCAAF